VISWSWGDEDEEFLGMGCGGVWGGWEGVFWWGGGGGGGGGKGGEGVKVGAIFNLGSRNNRAGVA